MLLMKVLYWLFETKHKTVILTLCSTFDFQIQRSQRKSSQRLHEAWRTRTPWAQWSSRCPFSSRRLRTFSSPGCTDQTADAPQTMSCCLCRTKRAHTNEQQCSSSGRTGGPNRRWRRRSWSCAGSTSRRWFKDLRAAVLRQEGTHLPVWQKGLGKNYFIHLSDILWVL